MNELDPKQLEEQNEFLINRLRDIRLIAAATKHQLAHPQTHRLAVSIENITIKALKEIGVE